MHFLECDYSGWTVSLLLNRVRDKDDKIVV